MMTEAIVIRLAEFSRFPSGRDDTDGDFNGKAFRERILAPEIELALKNNSKVCVSLDGVLSFGSSFLEEAFGGLVRNRIATSRDVLRVLEIEAENPSYERFRKAIIAHIKDAKVKN